jgi:hypothetical protein
VNIINSSYAVTGNTGDGDRNFDRMVFARGHCGASPEMLRRCGSGLFGLGAVFRLGHRPLRACSLTKTSPQDQKSSLLITPSFLSMLLGDRKEGDFSSPPSLRSHGPACCGTLCKKVRTRFAKRGMGCRFWRQPVCVARSFGRAVGTRAMREWTQALKCRAILVPSLRFWDFWEGCLRTGPAAQNPELRGTRGTMGVFAHGHSWERSLGCQSFASHRLYSDLFGFIRLFLVCFFVVLACGLPPWGWGTGAVRCKWERRVGVLVHGHYLGVSRPISAYLGVSRLFGYFFSCPWCLHTATTRTGHRMGGQDLTT